jgi:hypothetical protein
MALWFIPWLWAVALFGLECLRSTIMMRRTLSTIMMPDIKMARQDEVAHVVVAGKTSG